jgi:Reverse transcriptase (RNA-dependent DNA polymerase)
MKTNTNLGRTPKFSVSTFNAQSISSDSFLLEFENALKEISYDVIGLSEVKRIGEGKIILKGFTLYYTGKERRRGTVGFVVKSKWSQNVIAFKSYSDRVVSLNMEFAKGKLGIVQGYAPTSTSSESEINDFYQQMSKAVDEFSEHTWLVVMGDMNAKVGQPQIDEKDVMGQFGIGERNDRGEMLIDFARKRELFISNTQFKKRLSRRWTWHLGRGWNEIDYILVRKSQKNLVTDVSVVNSFKFSSDHRMVRMKIHLNVKPMKKFTHPKSRIVVTKDELKVVNFNRQLQSILISQKSAETVQDRYDAISGAVLESAEAFRVKKPKDLIITLKTRDEIDEREKLKRLRFQSVEKNVDFIKQRKKTNRMIRKDVHDHDVLGIQQAIENGKSLRSAKNGYAPNKCFISQLANRQGEVVSHRSGVLEVAASFYEDLYESTLSDEDREKLCPFLSDEEEEIEQITIDEIEATLATMKNAKATGADEISSDLFKVCGDVGLSSLCELFNEIIASEDIPTQWFESTIVLIHKKGDRKDIANYRPITLTSHIYKLFMKVLLNRMTETLDEQQPPNQAGFRKGYSTTDHLFVINQIVEKCNEYNQQMFCAFIDYTKAFDSIEHPFLWIALKDHGAHQKYIRILKKIYENSKARVKMETFSRWFKIKRGIKQGDPFSPKAFNSALEKIFSKINWENRGLKMGNLVLSELRFADDVALLSDNEKDLISMMKEVFIESKLAGLCPNVMKTKIITNTAITEVEVDDEKYEVVDDYTYLGQIVSFDSSEEKQINTRIAAAWRSYWALKKFFKSRMPLFHKQRLFDACVLPVFTYGCQTWTMTENTKSKLAVAQRSMERSMMNVRRKDKIRNTTIRKATKVKDVVATARKLKWNWAGHLVRHSDERFPKIVESWVPKDSKRKPGRPKARWKDEIVEHGSVCWRRKAKQRETWQKMGTSFIIL